MSFSRCLAASSVAASGGFSSPSVYLAQVLFRNEVECRATGSPACAYLHLGAPVSPHPPLRGGATDSDREEVRGCGDVLAGRLGMWR